MNRAAPTPPIVDIQHAEVYRGEQRVFADLSLRIATGQHTVVLGPNGSGKSTLLKLLTRELYPVEKAGSVLRLFGETHINLWRLRERIGVVSQDLQQRYDTLANGRDVVLSAFFGSVGLHGHHHVSSVQRERAEAALARFRLEDLAEKRYLSLSTGQQRRLLLARATVHTPQAVIFDEPTNSLDMRSAFQLLDDMQTLARQGTTVILVTHHMQEILPEIRRAVLLQAGSVVFDGAKSEALVAPRLSALFDCPLQVVEREGRYLCLPA